MAAGGNETLAYACEAPAVAVAATVSFCNKTAVTVRVRLAIGPGPDASAPGTTFLEYGARLEANEPLERTGIALSVGRKLFVHSDTAGVDFAVYGFEKA